MNVMNMTPLPPPPLPKNRQFCFFVNIYMYVLLFFFVFFVALLFLQAICKSFNQLCGLLLNVIVVIKLRHFIGVNLSFLGMYKLV